MRTRPPFLRSFAIVLVLCIAVSGCDRTPDPLTEVSGVLANLTPAPVEFRARAGEFIVSHTTTITYSDETSAAVARYLEALLGRTTQLNLKAADSAAENAIRFRISEAVRDGEGYELDVTPKGIDVRASTPAGLFYGAVSVWQFLTAGTPSDTVTVPAQYLVDAPRFKWRGVMLDSARHYQSPEFIKKFIDAMALHKLNVLHWHLTDDQAWRLEIKKYPRLTSVGAWRVPAGQAPAANIDPATNRPRTYGGFYSQADVRDIVAYAAARHITIVPEIEMPGHASAAIAAYPQLGVEGNAVKAVPADWGVYANLYNVDDATFAFLEDVLREVLELFPSQYIHIGGDEAAKPQWQASSAIQAKMKALSIADEHGLQSYFVQRIEKFLNAEGRRLIGWDEILEGGLAPNATVMSWRGIDGAVAAATAGHDTVLSPGPTLYFDNRPFAAPVPGRARVVSIEEVYRFDPAPAQIDEAKRKHILGVQANLWTEHIRNEARVEYMAFPRLAALSEVAWSAPSKIDWSDFERRLPAQLERYHRLNIRFAPAPAESSGQPTTRFSSHELELCSENIALSLEDDAPLDGPRAVFLVDIMNPCWKLHDVALAQPTRLVATVGQVPFNFQIGADIEKIKLRSPAATGELEVRAGGCEGAVLASLSLAPAVGRFALTQLPAVTLPSNTAPQALCFQFTQSKLDPLWVLDSIEFQAAGSRSEG